MQIIKIAGYARLLAAIAVTAQLAGCGGGGNIPPPQGTLRVTLTNTDASTCGYDEVNISVDAVRANPSASAGPNDGGWQPRDVTLVQSLKFDLLKLINNAPQDLVTTSVPAGHYSQLRLWLEGTSVLVVTPNSVVRSGTKFPLDTSNASSISIPYEFNVPANGQVALLLDFDVCRSVVDMGNGKFQLIPVVTATSTSGT